MHASALLGVGLVAILVIGASACSPDESSSATQPDAATVAADGGGEERSQIIDRAPPREQDAASVDGEVNLPPFTPPYALPASGQALAIPIAGRNVANDIKPAPHGNGSWQYALFQSYGGGSFSADYSAAGAYVLAGMGGHNAAPCFGAAIFDFTTATWSYLPNGNGFDEARTNDVDRVTETNGSPYLELVNVSQGQMPAPAHNYLLQISPPRSVVGGPKGSIVRTVGAAQTENAWDSPQSHALDLATGLWTRASANLVKDVYDRTPYTDSLAAYDPTTKRIYYLLGEFSTAHKLAYLDLADGTWKSAGSFAEPPGSSTARTMFVDDARRLLLVIRGAGELWAFDLDDVASGPKKLNVSGTVPVRALRWDLYPTADGGDGAFYTFEGTGPVYTDPPYPLATLQRSIG